MTTRKTPAAKPMRSLVRGFFVIMGFALLTLIFIIGSGLAVMRLNEHTFAAYWQGKGNQSGDYLLVILGDSFSQGIGASQPETSYVNLLAGSIEDTTGRTVRILNMSERDATVQSTLRRQAPVLTRYDADLTVLAIGANDIKHEHDGLDHRFIKDYTQLLQMLPPGKAVVADLPNFGERKHLNRRAEAVNHDIHELARAYNIPVAPVYNALKNQRSPWLFATDFFHPNDRGHKIWHDTIWRTAQPRIITTATPAPRIITQPDF